MMDRHILADILQRFEKQYIDDISNIEIHGFNAWQILKGSLFFALSGAHDHNENGATNGSSDHGKLHRAIKAIGNVFYTCTIFVREKISSKKVFFYTDSSDKPARREDGKFFNFLVDPIIRDGLVTSYTYGEQSSRGRFREPSFIKKQFNIDRFNGVMRLYERFFVKSDDIVEPARVLAELLNRHFAACGLELRVTPRFLLGAFRVFKSEYACWRSMLKAMRPKLIMASEKPGSGFMAAALSLKIPTIDLQHGIIDKNHPQYMYDVAMARVKETMVLPTKIGVFGDLHRETLLQSGFWQPVDITTLGSSRVDDNRKRGSSARPKPGTILLPTQWTCFEQTRFVLDVLSNSHQHAHSIWLKLHPLEPEAYANFYRQLQEKHPTTSISVLNKDADIYEWIRKARLVIGFDSAVLLEAISLGKPCITLTTPSSPRGILSLFDSACLEKAILSVPYDAPAELETIISRAMNDETFYGDWVQRAEQMSQHLYASNYTANCRLLIADFGVN